MSFISLARRRADLDARESVADAVLAPDAALLSDDLCPQTVYVMKPSALPVLVVSSRADARRARRGGEAVPFLYTGPFADVSADFRAPGYDPRTLTREAIALLLRASLEEERRALEAHAGRRAALAKARRAARDCRI